MACIGYADPPYIGCAHLYAHHPDYAGEVDHGARFVEPVREAACIAFSQCLDATETRRT